jgi:tRNA threonylcarbamoyladenosine biosynthesis protein TsaE
MQRLEYHKDKIDQTAKGLLKFLKPGDILALSGPLAAGKTTLTQAILRQMDYPGHVSSPTFVIEHRYPVEYKKFNEVIHLDFYRLNHEQIAKFDWAEYRNNHGQLTIIEWPENAAKLLTKNEKTIKIEEIDEQTRRLTLSDNFAA